MNYIIDINDRPWQAIKNKTKEIEVRTNTPFEKLDYNLLKEDDTLTLVNNDNLEQQNVKVLRITHYKTVRELLEQEGTTRTLSSGKDLEGGIESINSLTGYKEGIEKHGVWAIQIIPIDNI